MAVKLTKNEQKKQKDALKQYERYLPTLQLKKQQLQTVIRQIQAEARQIRDKKVRLEDKMRCWLAVFNENPELTVPRIEELVKVDSVKLSHTNVAGVSIPVFEELAFKEINYDYASYPLWVDPALAALRSIAELDARDWALGQQVQLLEKELLTTSQRVNLFEKVKIPEAKENIRRIGIYLGDQQTSAVVRGKIAKKKLVREEE